MHHETEWENDRNTRQAMVKEVLTGSELPLTARTEIWTYDLAVTVAEWQAFDSAYATNAVLGTYAWAAELAECAIPIYFEDIAELWLEFDGYDLDERECPNELGTVGRMSWGLVQIGINLVLDIRRNIAANTL